ncbi:MAG: hypothetical protein EP335_05565 [Alphaproteobacteria bacterium]|nr:MAG: hypothetical protein EP335_05565 [Alphaproteobacteria bacterium]
MDILICRTVPLLPTQLLIIAARFGANLYVAVDEDEVKALLKPSNIEAVIMDAMLGAEKLGKMVTASEQARSIASIHISSKRGGEAGFIDFVERALSIYSLLRQPIPLQRTLQKHADEGKEKS